MEFQNWSLKILNKWTVIITSTLGSWTLKSAIVGRQAILHGRWGVAQGCNCQHMLSAIASLIRAQRYEMALAILDNELGGTLFCMTALSR